MCQYCSWKRSLDEPCANLRELGQAVKVDNLEIPVEKIECWQRINMPRERIKK